MAELERRTIHDAELPDLPPEDVFYHECNTFRRELPRLLAEGYEGKFAVVKGHFVVGVRDTWDAARKVALNQFSLEPVFVHPIHSEEPVLRDSWYRRSCRLAEVGRITKEMIMEKLREGEKEPPRPPSERLTIHYTELTGLPADSPIHHDWNAYRRELPRLLAEGHEGKFILLKGDWVVGIFESQDEAMEAGYERFLRQPFLVKQILVREPVYRLPWCYR